MKFAKAIYPLLVVLLAVFAIAPLGYPGAFQSHTGLLAYYNLIDLDQNPALGWAPIIGQQFDLFRTDGALPYLIAEIPHLIGFSYLDAIKLVYALAWLASGLTMYALARRWFSENGALLAAIVYIYLPFHIATVYVRGAFAESVAWSLFPALLLSLLKQQTTNNRLPTAYCLLLTAALFLTQPGIAMLFSLLAFVIVVALERDWRVGLRSLVSGLVIGTLLYLPTVFRYGVNIPRDGFNAGFVLPFQLFSSLWGFGTSTGSYLDRFPFQLGVAPIGLAIIAVALAWRANKNDTHRVIAIFFGTAIVLSLLTFQITAPLWNLLSLFVAYPWQLLAFVGLVLALVAGSVIEFDTRLSQPAMLAFFVVVPIFATYNYLAPRFVDVNPARPTVAIFGDNEIALWDYKIIGPLRHGATVRLRLTWQALRLIDQDYTIFVSAVNEDGKTYAQEESQPQGGASPTLKWTPGQVISDTHTIQIDVDGPTEGYHIEFEVYDTTTGKRALTTTGVEYLILPRPGDPEPTIMEQVPSQSR